MTVAKQTLAIGGIQVHVYSDPSPDISPSCPLAVLFLLHGRTGSAAQIEIGANIIVQQTHNRRIKSEGGKQLDLIVVTFDHRNHGSRVISSVSNNSWSNNPEQNNDKHAIDMYSIQTGSARDVSFLIDFLPAYLFPDGERTVSQWMISGISLGGHSTWIALKNDPRITLGIPIIGCPDFLTLMPARAEQSGVKFEPPYVPESLLQLIKKDDPAASSHYTSSDPSLNPFYGKKILVLEGEKDTLVPWSASKNFVENLCVGENGKKKVIIVPGVGHDCTPAMVEEAAAFIWNEA